MSGSSSYNTYESEDESTGWLMTSETSVDDELSDELTLLNGDEDSDDDTSSFEALIKLSMRLKKQYNLREAAVQLERCDKIWDTMQLVKQMQMDNETGQAIDDDNDEDETEKKCMPPATLRLPEGANSAIPYIKYQPVQGNGNNALPNFYLAVKSQKKLYNCVTCGKQYSEERSLRLHSQKEHDVVMPKATKKIRRTGDIKPASQDLADNNKTINNSSNKDRDNGKSRFLSSTEQQSQRKRERKSTDSGSSVSSEMKKEPETRWSNDNREKPYICSICSTAYIYLRSLTTHMTNVHDMTLEEIEEINKKNSETLPRPRYIYTCKICGQTFPEKTYLRVHAKKNHDIVIPLQRKLPLRIEGQIKYYFHYTCETIKPSELPKPRILLSNEPDKSYLSKSITNDDREQRRITRSRKLIGNNVNRPRRACAANTSYTECTKEEEEEQKQLILSNIAGESAKSSNNQATPCFLCKKSFVDIRKHLVDYHRINCPETIIPLAKNVVKSEKDTVASSEIIETLPDSETTKNLTKVKQTNVKLNDKNNCIRLLPKTNNNNSKWDPRRYQCVLCYHKYNRREHLQRHLKKYTINGVVQEHTYEINWRRKKRNDKDPLVDPLALTDFTTESSKSESQGNPTDEDDAQITGRQKIINDESEDERLDFEHLNKRRKIEQSRESINPGSNWTSDCVQYNKERETVLVMAETDNRLNQQEEKTENPRDTRDSSDRDSGIGISITIKKRNNSYEVVEKDSGDDDKSKDFEHSKDDNTSSDSSSDVTPVIFVNDDQEARRREILNSLDYNVEKNVVESVIDDYVVIDAYDEKTEQEQTCSNNDKEATYFVNEEKQYGKDACASFLGDVPSLKVMCTNVLKKYKLMNINLNHLISHQCPVCHRFYPTERDVTVHMIEHKVSRSDFRATRIHAIPSSALRRYGRRPV